MGRKGLRRERRLVSHGLELNGIPWDRRTFQEGELDSNLVLGKGGVEVGDAVWQHD
jgi:hypothetical protein